MDRKVSLKPTSDDAIERLKGTQESFGFWTRRKRFLKAYWGMFPPKELDCLSYCYTNILTFGCSYSEQKMTLLDLLVRDMVSDMMSKSEKKVAKTIRRLWEKRMEEIEDMKENRPLRTRNTENKAKNEEEEIIIKCETVKNKNDVRDRNLEKKKRTDTENINIANIEKTFSNNRDVHSSLQSPDGQKKMITLESVEKEMFQTASIAKSHDRNIQHANNSLDTKSRSEARLDVQTHSRKGASISAPLKPHQYQNAGVRERSRVHSTELCPTGQRTIGRGLSWLSLFNISDLDGKESEKALSEIQDASAWGRITNVDRSKQSALQGLSPNSQHRTVPTGTTSKYGLADTGQKCPVKSGNVQQVSANSGKTNQVLYQNRDMTYGKKKTTPERLREVSEKIKHLEQLPSKEKKESMKHNGRSKFSKSNDKQRNVPKLSAEKRSDHNKFKGFNSALNMLKSAKEKVKQVVAVLGSNKSEGKVLEVPGRYVPKKTEGFESDELYDRAESLDKEITDGHVEGIESGLEEKDDENSYSDLESSCSWESVQSDSDQSVCERNQTSISHVRSQITKEIHRKHTMTVTGSKQVKKKTSVPTYTDLLRCYYKKGSGKKVVKNGKDVKSKNSAVPSVAPICKPVIDTHVATDNQLFDLEEHRRKIRNYSDLLKEQYMYKTADWYNNNEETGYHGDLDQRKSSPSNRGSASSFKRKVPIGAEKLEMNNGGSIKQSSREYYVPVEKHAKDREMTGEQDVTRIKQRSMTFINSTMRGRGILKQSNIPKDSNNNTIIPYCRI
ncbi:hypothetical protein FSP39_010190 [Pinctada imbricata]|uniref:XRN2-binding (XTBD) domain-containing protein n=1 Tax=Pinctada imbricata TaxID=66713 RepID=A0AA88XW68_PINIB|nr:hypothetical protein FSP39_010190 [Pinctada imbricata]